MLHIILLASGIMLGCILAHITCVRCGIATKQQALDRILFQFIVIATFTGLLWLSS